MSTHGANLPRAHLELRSAGGELVVQPPRGGLDPLSRLRPRVRGLVSRRTRVLVLLAVIFGLGAFLRFHDLGSQSLWLDETLTAAYVNAPLAEVARSTFSTNNPPLPYLIQALTVRTADSSEFWLRFPSAVFSALGILVAYLVASTLINRRAGLITAFFVSISPFDVNYAQEARSYALLYLVVSLSYLFFFRWQERGGKRDLWLWALTSASLAYIHYLGPLAIAAQYLIFFLRRDSRGRWRQWATAQVVLVVAWLPLAANLMRRISAQIDGLWIPEYSNYTYLFAKTVATVSGMLIYQRYLPELLALGLGLSLAFVRWEEGRPRLRFTARTATLLLMLLVPFLLLLLHNELLYPLLTLTTIRYIGYVALPLWMLLALGLDATTGRSARLSFIAVLAMSLAINHLAPYYFEHAKINSQNWRAMVAQVCNDSTAEDVVVTTRLSQRPFQYYGAQCFEGTEIHETFGFDGEPERVFYLHGHQTCERWEPPASISGYRLAQQKGGWIGYRRFDRDPFAPPRQSTELMTSAAGPDTR